MPTATFNRCRGIVVVNQMDRHSMCVLVANGYYQRMRRHPQPFTQYTQLAISMAFCTIRPCTNTATGEGWSAGPGSLHSAASGTQRAPVRALHPTAARGSRAQGGCVGRGRAGVAGGAPRGRPISTSRRGAGTLPCGCLLWPCGKLGLPFPVGCLGFTRRSCMTSMIKRRPGVRQRRGRRCVEQPPPRGLGRLAAPCAV